MLAAIGAEHRYPAISGRAGTARLLGIAVAPAVAAPVLAVGGYPLAAALSVAACLAAAAVAMRFPEAPAVLEESEPYLATLRAGAREALGRHLVGLVALLALLAGVTGIEEDALSQSSMRPRGGSGPGEQPASRAITRSGSGHAASRVVHHLAGVRGGRWPYRVGEDAEIVADLVAGQAGAVAAGDARH